MKDKWSETVRDALNDFKIELRRIWRFHADREGEFLGRVDRWLRENSIQLCMARKRPGWRKTLWALLHEFCRSFLPQAGAPKALWAEASTFISEVRNWTKRKINGTVVEPLLRKLRENDENAESLPEGDGVQFWLRGDVK